MKRGLLFVFLMTGLFGQVSVNIETVPPGAEITIDGAKAGETPISNYSMMAGHHEFLVNLKNFSDLKYETNLLPAKSATLRFRMKKRVQVKFASKTKGLTFRFDQKYSWAEKKIRFDMETGRHQLDVFRGDSLVDQKTVVITQPTTIQYSLEKPTDN